MLAGEEFFQVAAGSSGTTFEHQGCVIKFDEQYLNVYDTAGLNETVGRELSAHDTLQQLYDLLHSLKGINLLVFVMRFRITKNTVDNYRLIRAILCEEKIPIVVAITGREYENDNESWWEKNKANFARVGMMFDGHAIGTAHPRLASDPTYTELRTGLQFAIRKYGHQGGLRYIPSQLEDSDGGERVHRWFENTVVHVLDPFWSIFGKHKEEFLRLYDQVLKSKGMLEDQVAQSTERVKEKLGVEEPVMIPTGYIYQKLSEQP
jgi:hypothetical protein